MKNKFYQIIAPFAPFLILGVVIVFFIFLFIFLSYVFIWGALLGAICWGVAWVKNYFFPKPKPPSTSGRIIEHDDKR